MLSLAVAAAKVVKRPVKLMLSREGVHLAVGGRTPTEQRVALAANDDGKLTALIHTGFTQTTEHNNFPEPFTFPARHLYKSDKHLAPAGDRASRHRAQYLHAGAWRIARNLRARIGDR